jgi:hypothetical protein
LHTIFYFGSSLFPLIGSYCIINFCKWEGINSIFSHYYCVSRARVAQSVQRLGSGLENWGWIHSRCIYEIFLFITMSILALGPTQPPIQWALGVKHLGCEADHPHPSITGVKSEWSFTSTPPVCFHGMMFY